MNLAASMCFSFALIIFISLTWFAVTVRFMEITEL